MEELDTIATQKSWAQGSLQKPFTSIVTLYMHEQLSLDQAVREITNVIKNIYYADGDVGTFPSFFMLDSLFQFQSYLSQLQNSTS